MTALVDKEAYKRDGFVVVPGLLGEEEAEKLKAEMKRLLARVDAGNVPAGGNRYEKTGVFVGLAANSALFRAAAAHRRIAGILRQLIGDHVMFLSDKVVFKNAKLNFGSPWHQDWPYWKGSHKMSVWIALDAADRYNGCLKVIPGSHKRGRLDHAGQVNDDRGFGNRLDETQIDESNVVTLEIAQGGAVFFHDLLFHASYPNVSGEERYTLISTYKDGMAEDPEYSWAVAAFSL